MRNSNEIENIIQQKDLEGFRRAFRDEKYVGNLEYISNVRRCFMYASYDILNDLVINYEYYGMRDEASVNYYVALDSLVMLEMSYFYKCFPLSARIFNLPGVNGRFYEIVKNILFDPHGWFSLKVRDKFAKFLLCFEVDRSVREVIKEYYIRRVGGDER